MPWMDPSRSSGREADADSLLGEFVGGVRSPLGLLEADRFFFSPVLSFPPIAGYSKQDEEDDSHLGDFIEDPSAPAPQEAASNQLLKEQVIEILSTLTPRERKVLELRFGIEDGRSRTLEEVGKEFSVTRERIRQIEAKALRKLRHPSRSTRLRDYLD